MIRYTLRCAKTHEFESWFQSASGFDALLQAGQIACPLCGDTGISKSLMAPSVRPARNAGSKPSLAEPLSEAEAAMTELRRKVEENADYVGVNFVAEARRMHEGEIDQRSIYGEAKPEEAIALLEEGIPVAPLPFIPARKVS
ncbi:MAG: DUF1178 family protein [Cypionkella sp.]